MILPQCVVYIYIYLPYITHYSSFRFLFHYPEYSGRAGLSFEGSGFGFRSFGVFSGHVCVKTHRLYSAGARVLVQKPSSVNPEITGLAGMLYVGSPSYNFKLQALGLKLWPKNLNTYEVLR